MSQHPAQTAADRDRARATRPRWPFLAVILLSLLAGTLATGDGADPLVFGVFEVGPESVIDGDTLRLPAGQRSVRILGVDCEEIFKSERDREACAAGFEAYARAKRGDRPRPVKFGTPAGEAAKQFVVELMRDVKEVRLERDRVGGRERGTFGRRLAHAFLLKPQGEVNLALALIRAGHSPHFVKYGRSERFDAAFEQAQAEARAAGRGIWGSSGPSHYPDYDERLAWWRARAVQTERWKAVRDEPGHVTLGEADADRKLRERVGKEAVVFGLLDRELKVSAQDRRILLLGHQPRRGLPLVFFSVEVFESLDMGEMSSMFVTARGTLTLYKGRPQMVIESAEQISTR